MLVPGSLGMVVQEVRKRVFKDLFLQAMIVQIDIMGTEKFEHVSAL